MHKGSSINDSQVQAIIHGEGPALVLAGPGSGKTLVITKRIKHLIQSYHIEPSEILVITFTKSAVIEMKERFQKIMEDEYFPVTFGTFHSVFFQILMHTYQYDSTNIIKDKEKKDCLKEVLLKQKIPIEWDSLLITSLLSEISKIKNVGIPIETYCCNIIETIQFRNIFHEYTELLHKKRKVDFDDMVLECRNLLLKRKDILSLWQQKFHYILIDEFQDINPLQYEVIKLLAEPRNNLFIVGDDDQSIYGFRGANPRIMLNFPIDFPNCIKIVLNTNYRSRRLIVKSSLYVINQNKDRFFKDIKTNSSENGIVEVKSFISKQEEFLRIQAIIQKYCNSNHFKTTPYKNIAIIFRTNKGATFLMDRMIENQIPFSIKEKIGNIYEHFIAKDLLAYLKIAAGFHTREYLFEIMNKPKRYLSRSAVPNKNFTFLELFHYYKNKTYMFEILQKFSYDVSRINHMIPFAAIQYIRKAIGYDLYLQEYAKEKQVECNEFFELIEEIAELSKGYETLEQWEKHIIAYSEELAHKDINSNDKNGIHLLTLHGCKGLEFPVIIIPDINEGVIPHKKAITKSEIEEERRMFYVGMTRAKEELYLLYINEKEGRGYQPSIFLKNIKK